MNSTLLADMWRLEKKNHWNISYVCQYINFPFLLYLEFWNIFFLFLQPNVYVFVRGARS